MIVGEDYITSKKRYKCNICDFEWISPEKEYEKCPDCQSNDIIIILENEESEGKDLSLLQRRSYGGPGIRVGPPRVCKCPECGYESPKTRAVPCRNTKCPKCETPLCGSD
jgi:peptide subunit release factor 1 (eRF1)